MNGFLQAQELTRSNVLDLLAVKVVGATLLAFVILFLSRGGRK